MLAPHVLDDPVRSALTGPHAGLAVVKGNARRYPEDMAPFVAVPARPTSQDWVDAAALVPPGSSAAFIRDDLDLPSTWTVERSFELLQMTAGGFDARPDPEAVVLGVPDVPAMLALTAATRPGPFLPRTHELGRYVGLRAQDDLIAMAGERFCPPGWTEISAVCTAASHRGRGLATRLMRDVAARVEQRGDTAFLHVVAANPRAIALYEVLGFVVRTRLTATVATAPPR